MRYKAYRNLKSWFAIPMHSSNIVLSETKLISAHFQKSSQDWITLAHLCYLTIEWSWLKDWVRGHPLSEISSQALGGLPMVYCAKFPYPGSRDYSWVSALQPDQKSKSHTQKFVWQVMVKNLWARLAPQSKHNICQVWELYMQHKIYWPSKYVSRPKCEHILRIS